MYGHIPPNALPPPPIGNEQVVFFTPTPGLAPPQNVYAAPTPIAHSPVQFSAQGAPQVTGMSPSAAYGCGPVIGVQVPMWAHVTQTPAPTVIGSMMPSYATQPLQYQTCFMPPLQHPNQGMYFNSQVQPYSVVPQQYIPMANQGFRQHLMMRQPPNVPYIMPHHDYVAVANSGYSHTMAGAFQPQFIASDIHTRDAAVYEMSSVQHGQYVAQYPKPPQQMSAFGQRRTEIFNQLPSFVREERESPKLISNSEEQGGINFSHSLKTEEESSNVDKPVSYSWSSADTVTTTCDQAPTPAQHLHLLDELAEPMQQTDASHSPSETTLVPSPSSSDGAQTVCSSPFLPEDSDPEEHGLIAIEDDQIPTKDTDDEVTLPLLEPCYCDNIERLEPEQPYDNASNSYHKTKPLLNDLSSVHISSPPMEHSSTKNSVETVREKSKSANPSQCCHHQQPIRRLIDTPVYNTAHSRVLSQLAQPNDSIVQPQKASTQRPLTTHFRQLFKPIPFTSKKDIKGNNDTK